MSLQIKDALISHGCFLQECDVIHSVVGERSRLDSGVVLKVIYPTFTVVKKLRLKKQYLGVIQLILNFFL